jgi:hypothetical protein
LISNVPNLRQLFGDRYRIEHDPEGLSHAEKRNPWMMQIPCREHGITIFAHAPDLLAVVCDNHPRISNRLAALGLRLHQEGDRQKTFLFPVERFDDVAATVRPRRRRVSEQQVARLIAAGTAYRFVSASKGASRPPKAASEPLKGIKRPKIALATVGPTPDDQQPVGCKASGHPQKSTRKTANTKIKLYQEAPNGI